jgi:hypothetical protein
MHKSFDPQRTRKSRLDKTPGQRVHGWFGGIHDGRTNSPSLLHDHEAERSAIATKHQLRGFMVANRGVHDGDRAAIFTGRAPRGLRALRSALRSPPPLSRQTSGAPTAAARRPERGTLLGIVALSPCRTWWEPRLAILIPETSSPITAANPPRPSRGGAMNPSRPDRIPREDREPEGLTVSPGRATIMKVAARHEADSKIGVQYY